VRQDDIEDNVVNYSFLGHQVETF